MDNKLDRENYSQESNMEETEEYRPADGRIVVKLILPRMPEVAPPEEEIKSHYCKECDKSFSSGKALGGHMSSAHVQANKDHSVKKLKSRIKKHRKDGTGSSLGPTAVNICEICWKNFPSKKSLFGHMRKHPDRDWRGMNPPPSSSQDQKIKSPPANSPETESEDDYQINDDAAVAAELDLSLNWAMRAKRGGRGTAIRPPQAEAVINSPPPPDFPISDNEILVARQLMKLFNSIEDQDEEGVSTNQPKRKRDYSCESTKKRKSRVCESVPNLKICEREGNNDAASHCRRKTENNNGKGKKKKKDCKSKDSNGTSSSSGSFPDDIDSGEEINLTAINHLKNPKKVAEISPEKYTCDKCNKSFPSHRALGGHSSSHNKFKMSIINSTNGKITSVRNRVNIAIRENCGSPVDDDDVKSHDMCKNNRRCHVDDENKKSAVKVVLDFDLNEEPVEEDPSS